MQGGHHENGSDRPRLSFHLQISIDDQLSFFFKLGPLCYFGQSLIHIIWLHINFILLHLIKFFIKINLSLNSTSIKSIKFILRNCRTVSTKNTVLVFVPRSSEIFSLKRSDWVAHVTDGGRAYVYTYTNFWVEDAR
jgi:hypothetical protein